MPARLEPLEVAEARCDAVLNDPASTFAQNLAAVSALYRRAYRDPTDAEHAIAAWVRNHDQVTARTLISLAEAVLALVDGLGGDDQEQDRASEIAWALRQMALGVTVMPLREHDAARAAWFTKQGRV